MTGIEVDFEGRSRGRSAEVPMLSHRFTDRVTVDQAQTELPQNYRFEVDTFEVPAWYPVPFAGTDVLALVREMHSSDKFRDDIYEHARDCDPASRAAVDVFERQNFHNPPSNTAPTPQTMPIQSFAGLAPILLALLG